MTYCNSNISLQEFWDTSFLLIAKGASQNTFHERIARVQSNRTTDTKTNYADVYLKLLVVLLKAFGLIQFGSSIHEIA